SQVGQRSSEELCIVNLSKVTLLVVHRAAGVYQYFNRNTCFYFRFPNIISIRSCIHFPVEPTEIVTRLVAAKLAEFESRTPDRTFIDTRQETVNHGSSH